MDIDKVVEMAKRGVEKFRDEHMPLFLILSPEGKVLPFVTRLDDPTDLEKVKEKVEEMGSKEYWSVTLGSVVETPDFKRQVGALQKKPSMDAMLKMRQRALDLENIPSSSEFKKASVVIGHHVPEGSEMWLMGYDVPGEGPVVFGKPKRIEQRGLAVIHLNVWAPRQFVA